jgi:hypothetical protein
MTAGVGVWGGGGRAAATGFRGMSSSRTRSEARFELRSSTGLWGIFRMSSTLLRWEEPIYQTLDALKISVGRRISE